MESIDAASFLSWHGRVHERTRAVAACIPERVLERAPAPGRFTPGDLVRHIAATERWMWGENVRGCPSRYPGHGRELAEGKDAVLAYLDRMHAETTEIIGGLSREDLLAKCVTVGGAEITVWKWLRLMVEHEVHHRGQLYAVLGAFGVEVPSLYGLTELEVLRRSTPSDHPSAAEHAP